MWNFFMVPSGHNLYKNEKEELGRSFQVKVGTRFMSHLFSEVFRVGKTVSLPIPSRDLIFIYVTYYNKNVLQYCQPVGVPKPS